MGWRRVINEINNKLFLSSFRNEKKQHVRVDRTVDKIVWPTKLSGDGTSTQPPAVSSEPSPTSISTKAALIELRPVTESGTEGVKQGTSFNLSVLVGDAHSLIRFTMYTRVPPQPKVKKGKKEVESSEKKESKVSNEEVEVKPKLLPKVQNEPQPENLSVTIEYSDSNL